ncbi:MAG: hypothetical protein RR346_05305 [Bacteroidales bacterium]
MRILNLILYCSAIVLSACSNENISDIICPVVTPENIQKQTHRERLFLSSSVKEIREYKIDAENPSEKMLSCIMTFDRSGNLTGYDPSGIGADPSLRWLPVFREVYTYRYDGKGRLSEVTAQAGMDIKNYRLEYGDHDTFVPLPFELKPVGNILLEGLVSVSCDEGNFSYVFDGREAIKVTSEFDVVEEDFYYFESKYPSRKISKKRYDGEEVRLAETIYSYNPKSGVATAADETVTEDGRVMKIRSVFMPAGLPASVYTDNGESQQKRYTYNPYNWLLKMEAEVDGISNGTLKCLYDTDAQNNWIRREQTVKGFVDWEYPEGVEITIREIAYW